MTVYRKIELGVVRYRVRKAIENEAKNMTPEEQIDFYRFLRHETIMGLKKAKEKAAEGK